MKINRRRDKDRDWGACLNSSSEQNDSEKNLIVYACVCDDDVGDYSLSSEDYTGWRNPFLL